ncbi:MAG: TolC family protein [candidate division WOR-3 bacterium]
MNRFFLTPFLLVGWLAADTLTLNEESAIQAALSGSPELAIYRAKINEAQARLNQARAPFMPQLSLSAGYTYLSYVQEMEMIVPNFDSFPNIKLDTVAMQFGQHNNYKAEVKLSQLIFSWGRVWNSYQMARQGLRAAELSLNAKEAEVSAKARTAFWGALVAREYWNLAKESSGNLEEHYRDAEKRYRAGVAPEFELLQAEVKWRNSLPQVADAEKTYRDALDGLKLLLGIPQETEVILEGKPEFSEPDIDDSAVVALALANRPELASLDEQAAALARLAAIQSAGDKPQVVAFAGYSYQRPYGFEDEWGGTWSAGLGITWNLFDGLASRGKSSEAKAQREQILLSRNLQAEAIKNEVRTALRGLNEAWEKLRSAESTVALAERGLSIAKVQKEGGVATRLALYDAELNLYQARTNLLATQMGYVASVAALEKAVGLPISEMPKKEKKNDEK